MCEQCASDVLVPPLYVSTHVVVNSMCLTVRLTDFDTSVNANTNVIVNKANDHGPGSLIYHFL